VYTSVKFIYTILA